MTSYIYDLLSYEHMYDLLSFEHMYDLLKYCAGVRMLAFVFLLNLLFASYRLIGDILHKGD